jgi:hypothetical protein
MVMGRVVRQVVRPVSVPVVEQALPQQADQYADDDEHEQWYEHGVSSFLRRRNGCGAVGFRNQLLLDRGDSFSFIYRLRCVKFDLPAGGTYLRKNGLWIGADCASDHDLAHGCD